MANDSESNYMPKRAKKFDVAPYLISNANIKDVAPYMPKEKYIPNEATTKKYYLDTSYHNIEYTMLGISRLGNLPKDMKLSSIRFTLSINNVYEVTYTDKNKKLTLCVQTKNMRHELSTIARRYQQDSFGITLYIHCIEVFYGYINTNYDMLKDNINNIYFCHLKNNGEKIIVASFSSETTTFTFYTVYSDSIDEL